MEIKKILKILVIIIFIAFFILGCMTIYKFIIIQKVLNKMKEYVSLENYHMKIIDNSENSTIEVYYKDGIGKMILSNGIYSWTDGNEAYIVDEQNKQIQYADWDSSILISNEYVGSMIPGYSKTTLEKFLLAGDLNTSIKVKKYDSMKYYKITTLENQKKTVWFKYDSLLPVQVDVNIGNANYSYNYDMSFNVVRESDVEKPNLEGYMLVEKNK